MTITNLQITSSANVYVNGISFFVFSEQNVNRGIILHQHPNVETFHLALISRFRRLGNFHRFVILRIEKFEEMFSLSICPGAIAEVGAYNDAVRIISILPVSNSYFSHILCPCPILERLKLPHLHWEGSQAPVLQELVLVHPYRSIAPCCWIVGERSLLPCTLEVDRLDLYVNIEIIC